MSDEQIADLAATMSPAQREQLVMRYWRRGSLTPLGVANSLARYPTREPAYASDRGALAA